MKKNIINEILGDWRKLQSKATKHGLDIRFGSTTEPLELYYNEDYPDCILVDKSVSCSPRRDEVEGKIKTVERIEFDNYYFSTLTAARTALDHMIGVIKHYDSATIADFYDIVGIDKINYHANTYGWTHLHDVGIKYDKHYKTCYIDFPKAKPLGYKEV